jgi:hypothetical protein
MLSNMAKTVADHEVRCLSHAQLIFLLIKIQYMGANCHYTGVGPTIETSIFDRTNVLSRIWYHDYLGNETAKSGIPYVIGETNSISCQGAANISDVMAAAVWAVDYVLYLSSLRAERVHFHMGTRYAYRSWLPVSFNYTAPQVFPIYYAALFNAHVFAGGHKQTEVLVNETDFSAYAVYGSGKLESIVAVNFVMWNSTFEQQERSYTVLELPSGWESAKVSRLTSPGVETALNITLAGQTVNEAGEIVGAKTHEKAVGRKVLVGAGEAVLVQR